MKNEEPTSMKKRLIGRRTRNKILFGNIMKKNIIQSRGEEAGSSKFDTVKKRTIIYIEGSDVPPPKTRGFIPLSMEVKK